MKTKVTYIAFDGTEFVNDTDCQKYEKKQMEKFASLIDTMRISELQDVMPINTDCSPADANDFQWYYVGDKEGIYALEAHYNIDITSSCVLPTYICIESDGYDNYYYDLKVCIQDTERFFERFGISVSWDAPNLKNLS